MAGALEVHVASGGEDDPRKARVRDWLVALASGDVDRVCAALAEDVVWEAAGGETLSGLPAVRREVERLGRQGSSVLRVRRLVADGTQVAAEGSRTSAGQEAQFACFVTLAGPEADAPIASVVAFRRL